MGIFGNTGQHYRNLIAFLEISALTVCTANAHTKTFVHHDIFDDGIEYLLDFLFLMAQHITCFLWGWSVSPAPQR